MDLKHHSDLDMASARNRRPIGAQPVAPPVSMYPGRIPLSGQRVALEPISALQHGEGLFAVGHADERALDLWKYLPYGPFADVPTMQQWLRGCGASADPVFVAVRQRNTKRLLGMASFLEIRPAAGVIEIGHIWFAPPFQGTPEVTETLFLMMCHAMDDLGNRRLEWKCNALNVPSRNAALRLGFRFEAVFYNHLTPKGHSRDSAWYSIIDSEWPAVKANLQTWLAANNFNAEGKQRQALSELNRALW